MTDLTPELLESVLGKIRTKRFFDLKQKIDDSQASDDDITQFQRLGELIRSSGKQVLLKALSEKYGVYTDEYKGYEYYVKRADSQIKFFGINRIDSDISDTYRKEVYSKSDTFTSYGFLIATIAFGMMMLGTFFGDEQERKNLEKKHEREDDFPIFHFAFFSLKAYHELGEDLLIGNLVENMYREIEQQESFKSRHEKNDVSDQIMNGIADGIEQMRSYYLGQSPALRLSTTPSPKPELSKKLDEAFIENP